MTTTAIQPLLCVYMGRAEIDKNLCAVFLPIELLDKCRSPDDAANKASSFKHKERELPRAIGAIYTVNNGVINPDSGRLEKMQPGSAAFYAPNNEKRHVNHEWIAIWEARDTAIRVATRSRKIEDELVKDSKLAKALAAVRDQYSSTDRIGRLALEVVVLDILRNGRSK